VFENSQEERLDERNDLTGSTEWLGVLCRVIRMPVVLNDADVSDMRVKPEVRKGLHVDYTDKGLVTAVVDYLLIAEELWISEKRLCQKFELG
jgi:hypothetical protein